MLIIGFCPRTVALGIPLLFNWSPSCTEPISISAQYWEIISEFCNNRQSAANTIPRFAYSFVSLILRQYYWLCNFYSAYGRRKKNQRNLFIDTANSPTSSIGMASASRLACKCRMQRKSSNFGYVRCIMQDYWHYVARTASPIFAELAYKLGSTYRKRKYGITKMKIK